MKKTRTVRELTGANDRIGTIERASAREFQLPGDGIETRTLSDQVYQYLTNRILDGEIGYGERLSLRDVAELLHVSTMPVREAFVRLSQENVITIKPRSTCIVNRPTRRSMVEAFEIREMIELHAVGRFWDRVKANELENLSYYLSQMNLDVPQGNNHAGMHRYAKFDQLFHQELVGLAQSASLLRIYRTNMMHLNIALTFRAGVAPDMHQVHEDHLRILDELQNNSEEAREILRRHLRHCRSNMIQGEVFRSLE